MICPYCETSISISDVPEEADLEYPGLCAQCGGLFWIRDETIQKLNPIETLIELMTPQIRLTQMAIRQRGGMST